jgi:hypothetical protein
LPSALGWWDEVALDLDLQLAGVRDRQIGALLAVADVERGGLGRAAGRGLVAEEDVVTAAGQQGVVAQVADQAVVAAAAADGRRRRRARG